MARGPLYQANYRPLFSGHETFPLRYGWLKKAYDAVVNDRDRGAEKSIFLNDEAIARFGVGKNMVASMRHWAACTGVVVDDPRCGPLRTTAFGDLLFGPSGVDPYLENPASLWRLHWLLCSGESTGPIKTTWYWVFNHFPATSFRRDDLVAGLMKLAEKCGWQRVSRTTVQRDVECFVRSYEGNRPGEMNVEGSLESPLGELGLIRGLKGQFHLPRGSKPSLTTGVFVVALDEFWARLGSTRTLSFEAIAHEPGSPGRVFQLDETELGERLLGLEDSTRGAFRWSETAGLKQVLRERPLREDDRAGLLRADYGSVRARKTA